MKIQNQTACVSRSLHSSCCTTQCLAAHTCFSFEIYFCSDITHITHTTHTYRYRSPCSAVDARKVSCSKGPLCSPGGGGVWPRRTRRAVRRSKEVSKAQPRRRKLQQQPVHPGGEHPPPLFCNRPPPWTDPLRCSSSPPPLCLLLKRIHLGSPTPQFCDFCVRWVASIPPAIQSFLVA